MNKIKNQLESAIEKKITKLVLDNFEFIVEGKSTELSQIKGVELYQPNDFDEILRDGKSHTISLQGVILVFEKTRIGSELVNLVFRQSNVEIKFNWETQDFSIEAIEKFRFSKSRN